jgi:hypothetical protein
MPILYFSNSIYFFIVPNTHTHARTDACLDSTALFFLSNAARLWLGFKYLCFDEWTAGWLDGWLAELMDERLCFYFFFFFSILLSFYFSLFLSFFLPSFFPFMLSSLPSFFLLFLH